MFRFLNLRAIIIIIALCNIMISSPPVIKPSNVTIEEAKMLSLIVPDALESQALNHNILLDCVREKDAKHKLFYVFWVVNVNASPNMSPTLGYYAINKKSGEIWSVVLKKRINSSLIREFQRIIRKRHFITKTIVAKYKHVYP